MQVILAAGVLVAAVLLAPLFLLRGGADFVVLFAWLGFAFAHGVVGRALVRRRDPLVRGPTVAAWSLLLGEPIVIWATIASFGWLLPAWASASIGFLLAAIDLHALVLVRGTRSWKTTGGDRS